MSIVGHRDFLTDSSQWSVEDKKKLLNAVVKMGGSSNTKSFTAVESSLKWEDIKVAGKSAKECKESYQKLISKVRKYRTMQEIIADAIVSIDEQEKKSIKSKKEAVNRLKKKYKQLTDKTTSRRQRRQYPGMPRKPPASYGLYVMEMAKKRPQVKANVRMKEFAKDWEVLPEKKKELYRKEYLRLMEKYREDLEIFNQNHPDCLLPRVKSADCPEPPLPSKLFVESHMEKTRSIHPELRKREAVNILKDEYKTLPDKEKLKWIQRAMRERQTYQEKVEVYLADNPTSTSRPLQFTLSKEEERIWHASRGKPVLAPPKLIYTFFRKTKMDEVSHLNYSERKQKLSTLYHNLKKEEVTDLQEAFIKEVKEYVQAYTSYYNSLSDDERSEEIAPEEALADYNHILQKYQTNKKVAAKRKTAGVHDANSNKAKQTEPPRPNADSNEDTYDTDTKILQKRQTRKKEATKLRTAAVHDANNKKEKLPDPPGPNADSGDISNIDTTILLKTQTKKKETAKCSRTAGVHDASSNKVKQSDPPRLGADSDDDIEDPSLPHAESDGDLEDPPRWLDAESNGDLEDPPRPDADSFGDIEDPPRPNADSFGDIEDPPRPNADSFGDIEDPPRPNADSFDDIEDPPRPIADSFDDIEDPPRPNADSFGDIEDPPRPNADSFDDTEDPPRPNADSFGDIEDPPRPNADSFDDTEDPPRPDAESDVDNDDPQRSSLTVASAKRKKKLQLDRKATQKKTKLGTSQNSIGPAQNATLDQEAQLSMATPQQSNVQVRTVRLRVRSPSPSTPSSESWQNSPVLAREMEIARRPPGFSGRGQSN